MRIGEIACRHIAAAGTIGIGGCAGGDIIAIVAAGVG
jgi:hypothetical protein